MSKIQEFWKWFTDNQKRLVDLEEPGTEEVLDELEETLHLYCPDLFFEVYEGLDEVVYELVITAEGDKKLFPKVQQLIDMAPRVKGWAFTALMPAQGFDITIEYEGITLDPKDIVFLPLENEKHPNQLGLRLFVEEYNEKQREDFIIAAFDLLSSALGEKSAALDIFYVDVTNYDDEADEDYVIPLVDLKNYLEIWKTEG